MEFKTIAEVQAHKFAGNYRDDAEAFDAISEFGEKHPEHYLAAARHISIAGMGIDPARLGEGWDE